MRHRTVDERVNVMRRYRMSARSLTAFAAAEGIAPNSLRRWLERYEGRDAAPRSSFVPVVVRTSTPSNVVTAPGSIVPHSPRASGVALDIGGVEVVVYLGFDRAVLGEVVEVLRGIAERGQ